MGVRTPEDILREREIKKIRKNLKSDPKTKQKSIGLLKEIQAGRGAALLASLTQRRTRAIDDPISSKGQTEAKTIVEEKKQELIKKAQKSKVKPLVKTEAKTLTVDEIKKLTEKDIIELFSGFDREINKTRARCAKIMMPKESIDNRIITMVEEKKQELIKKAQKSKVKPLVKKEVTTVKKLYEKLKELTKTIIVKYKVPLLKIKYRESKEEVEKEKKYLIDFVLLRVVKNVLRTPATGKKNSLVSMILKSLLKSSSKELNYDTLKKDYKGDFGDKWPKKDVADMIENIEKNLFQIWRKFKKEKTKIDDKKEEEINLKIKNPPFEPRDIYKKRVEYFYKKKGKKSKKSNLEGEYGSWLRKLRPDLNRIYPGEIEVQYKERCIILTGKEIKAVKYSRLVEERKENILSIRTLPEVESLDKYKDRVKKILIKSGKMKMI